MTMAEISEQEKLTAILADKWCFKCKEIHEDIGGKIDDMAACYSCLWDSIVTSPTGQIFTMRTKYHDPDNDN